MASRVVSTGYGRAALEALRTIVATVKHDDPMAPVTILVPNNIAGIVARRHLAHGLTDDHPGVAGIYVATLPRLAEQIAAPHLTPRRPATRPILASAWRSTLDAAPGLFASVSEHPATIRALTNAHRELRDLTEPALRAVAEAGRLPGDVARLHDTVTATLRQDWYDPTDLLRTATQLVDETPDTVGELGAAVLYLPQALTQAEAGFARALADHADLTVLVGLTGVRRADRTVRRTLTRLGLDQPEDSPKPPTATQVRHASDSDDEVRCIVREVVVTLKQTPAHRIAVLYGRASPYARLLHEQLNQARITFNGPGTRAVHERALARGFLGILDLAENDMPRAELFRALAEAPAHTFDQGHVFLSRWERVSRSAAVVAGGDWHDRLQAHIEHEQAAIGNEQAKEDPWQSRIDRSQREIESAQALQQFATTLRTRLAEGSALTTWDALSTWALALFHSLYGEPSTLLTLPAEEQYAAATIDQTLRSLASLDQFEPAASLSDLKEVLELELEGALPRVGRFGEGVFVAPVSAAVGLDAEVVFVLGLAEDTYPGRLHEDALLPERVRELTNGELAAARDQLDAKHRHLLAAFTAAPHVVASFPRGDLRHSTQRLPSRWLLHTLRDLTGNPDLAATEWDAFPSPDVTGSRSYASELRSTEQLASEQEWRVRAASVGHDLGDGTVDQAVEMIKARAGKAFTRYDGNLEGAQDLPAFATSERRVSPTSLESYAECPHGYFVRRMLYVEPLEQPEAVITISPMDIGNLIHESMDEFVAGLADALPSYGEPWTAEHHARLREIAIAKAQDFETRGVTGHPLLWQRERDRLLVDLDHMLDDDDKWRRDLDARVVASELTFGRDGAPPVVIDVASGRVHMIGSADKVDETRDGVLLVTDIKTGSTTKFKAINTDPVVAGTKLQLPVYAHAARQMLGGDRVEAQYWFVRKDHGTRVKVILDEELEQTYAETLGTLVDGIASGHFPAKAPEGADFGGWVRCNYCNPDGVGHGEVRERWERKRHDPVLAQLVGLIDPQPDVDGGETS